MNKINQVLVNYIDSWLNPQLEKILSKVFLTLGTATLAPQLIGITVETKLIVSNTILNAILNFAQTNSIFFITLGVLFLIVGLFFFIDDKKLRGKRNQYHSDITAIKRALSKYNLFVLNQAIFEFENNRIYNSSIMNVEIDLNSEINRLDTTFFDPLLEKHLKVIHSYVCGVIRSGINTICIHNSQPDFHRFPQPHEPNFDNGNAENQMLNEFKALIEALDEYRTYVKKNYAAVLVNDA